MSDVLDGAEPFSAAGGPTGVLVLHGFTGTTQSMRPLAEAMAAAGHTVEAPRLPGHGTTVVEMATTTWDDWSGHVEAIYDSLAARCTRVVVAGLSMGGTLTLWLASRHPEIAGIALINAAARPQPDTAAGLQAMIDGGAEFMEAIGDDIADPDAHELAYEQTPLRPLLSLLAAVDGLQDSLETISVPALVFTSPQDHVVAPADSEHIVACLAGPTEQVLLEQSYHVATLDYDAPLIAERLATFIDSL